MVKITSYIRSLLIYGKIVREVIVSSWFNVIIGLFGIFHHQVLDHKRKFNQFKDCDYQDGITEGYGILCVTDVCKME